MKLSNLKKLYNIATLIFLTVCFFSCSEDEPTPPYYEVPLSYIFNGTQFEYLHSAPTQYPFAYTSFGKAAEITPNGDTLNVVNMKGANPTAKVIADLYFYLPKNKKQIIDERNAVIGKLLPISNKQTNKTPFSLTLNLLATDSAGISYYYIPLEYNGLEDSTLQYVRYTKIEEGMSDCCFTNWVFEGEFKAMLKHPKTFNIYPLTAGRFKFSFQMPNK